MRCHDRSRSFSIADRRPRLDRARQPIPAAIGQALVAQVRGDLHPTEATIPLPFGLCELTADEAGLDVRLTPEADADVERFKTVVADHIQRFGHKETLVFDWRQA